MRILALISDDNKVEGKLIQSLLQRLGHDYLFASDHLEAWEIITESVVDVIICDCLLSPEICLEFCRKVRNRENNYYTYFIMLTEFKEHSDRLKGLEAGVDDYLLKPLRLEELENRLLVASRVTLSHRKLFEQAKIEGHLAEHLQALVSSSPISICGLDAQGKFNFAEGKSLEMIKLDSRKVLGHSIFEIYKDEPHVLWAARQALTGNQMTTTVEFGEAVFEMMYTPLRGQSGNVNGVSMIALDVTVRKLLEEVIWQAKERAQVTLAAIGEGMITLDMNGSVQYINPMAESLTGWLNIEAQGRPLEQIFPTVAPQEDNALIPGNKVEVNRKKGDEAVLLNRSGEGLTIEHYTTPIHDPDGKAIGKILIFRDISETKALANQLIFQASHDMLTGLINRREFEAQVTHALNTTKTQEKKHALCFLDLDQFKIVNDTCGHPAGDELLCQVAVLLKEQVRNSDTVARLGGDEFGILLENCPLEKGIQIANNIRHAINDFRFTWEGKSFTIGVSIGVAAMTRDIQNYHDLLSTVDSACYMAKESGRNRVHVYEPGDTEMAKRHTDMEWIQRINKAIEENRFCLYYQTIAPLREEISMGEHYEILLRMIGEDDKIISPMTFIPAAERYNMMHIIDRWVINAAFNAYNRIHKDNPLRPLATCAINLSAASINDPGFLTFLARQFALSAIPPEVVCFEITETAAIANLSKANHVIKEIKKLGCRFALDDFGSGFSSFAYLKNLPVDYLKIDASFVKDMVDDPLDCAMVEAINNIGHLMGMETIAEFVFNQAVMAKVKETGVDFAQGYAIAEPRRL